MSDFYDYGARNGFSIITDSGRVTQVKFSDNNNKTVILERGIADSKSFLSALEPFMDNFAKHHPHKFIKLFLSLTDDEEALKLAENAYDLHMDKRFYPLEDIKSLMSEQGSPLFTSEGLSWHGTANLHRVGVKNGIVVAVYNGNQSHRKDPEFISTITSFLMTFVEMEPQKFMELYDAIENDKICFKIADRIRKETARKYNTIFRFKEEGSSTSNVVQQFNCDIIPLSDRILVDNGIISVVENGTIYTSRSQATFYGILNKSLRLMACSNPNELERLCASIHSDETYYGLARGILDSTREKMAQSELNRCHCFTHQSDLG